MAVIRIDNTGSAVCENEVTVTVGDGMFYDLLTSKELLTGKRNGISDFFRKRYKIPEEEPLYIFQTEGCSMAIDWRRVL